jgi:hypothetical protein
MNVPPGNWPLSSFNTTGRGVLRPRRAGGSRSLLEQIGFSHPCANGLKLAQIRRIVAHAVRLVGARDARSWGKRETCLDCAAGFVRSTKRRRERPDIHVRRRIESAPARPGQDCPG